MHASSPKKLPDQFVFYFRNNEFYQISMTATINRTQDGGREQRPVGGSSDADAVALEQRELMPSGNSRIYILALLIWFPDIALFLLRVMK